MRWAQEQRMKFITGRLNAQGFVNRRHLMIKFGISAVQAAVDFRTYQSLYPKTMTYNATVKRYEATL